VDSAPAKSDSAAPASVDATKEVSPGEAVGSVKDIIAAGKAKQWWLLASLIIALLMGLAKWIGKKMGWWPKLGRVRYFLVPIASLAAALLAAFQGGVSWDAAIGVFTASWAMSSYQEMYEHGILGKERESAKPAEEKPE
jgi:hypothetical protein